MGDLGETRTALIQLLNAASFKFLTSLIFTDQTDDMASRTGGWDDYALWAQRQFYLVGWAITPLRYDPPLRKLWLDRNAAVLAGTLRPRELSLSRRYDGFYGVIDAHKPAPPGGERLYANANYVLYKLADDLTSCGVGGRR